MNLYTTRKPITISEARILAVDDEQALCDLVARWLNREGISCDTAYNVDEAISLMRRDHYDLVISDITMPGRSGIDFLGIVGENYPTTAMIMATAVDNRETAVSTLEKGAFGYIIKPFEKNEFIINVFNALERRRIVLEHENYEKHLEQVVRDKTEDIRNREEQIALRLISASGYRDEETGQHIRRIGLYGAILAEVLGWEQKDIDYMRVAGPMHDVGKIGIPDEILRKPGKLSLEEFAIIKQHAQIGARILENSNIPLLKMAHDIALYHHEKWDGSGYPFGLKEHAIPESAQIVALVDVYDALSNDRVYRTALPEEQVLRILKEGSGCHFNPLLFNLFTKNLNVFREILQEHADKREESRDSF
jgi:putative two-component system response regulator